MTYDAEARPPRQIDDTIPKELERICLKALSKRASDRYTTGRDMAEDLRLFLQTVVGTTSPVVAPGVVSPAPGSTQEATAQPINSKDSDSDQHQSRSSRKVSDPSINTTPTSSSNCYRDHEIEMVCLTASDSGRIALKRPTLIRPSEWDSSMDLRVVESRRWSKQDYLPRLAKHVLPVYIEATAEETEARLLRALRKTCPDLSPQMGLVDSLMAIRQGRVLRSGQKVLLVLDQFEQWLHARRGEENTELVNALRHCDGEHVQAVVLVRDDFWLAATRFMENWKSNCLRARTPPSSISSTLATPAKC